MSNYINSKILAIKVFVARLINTFLFNWYRRDSLKIFDPSIFKGKRVAIIGGADSAFKQKLGSYIESHDIIVRINNGVMILDKYKDYIGARTDILFHSFYGDPNNKLHSSPITIDLWNKSNVKNLVCCYNYEFPKYKSFIVNFIISTKGRYPAYQISKKFMQLNLEILRGYKPTTGFVALSTVLNSTPKEVYVTGFTFFKTGHNKDYRNLDDGYMQEHNAKTAHSHNIELEFEWFKNQFFAQNIPIKTDLVLMNILQANGENIPSI